MSTKEFSLSGVNIAAICYIPCRYSTDRRRDWCRPIHREPLVVDTVCHPVGNIRRMMVSNNFLHISWYHRDTGHRWSKCMLQLNSTVHHNIPFHLDSCIAENREYIQLTRLLRRCSIPSSLGKRSRKQLLWNRWNQMTLHQIRLESRREVMLVLELWKWMYRVLSNGTKAYCPRW